MPLTAGVAGIWSEPGCSGRVHLGVGRGRCFGQVDPRTGDRVVISSADHGFMVIDGTGRLTAAGRLPGHHRQAEGLAIMPDGRIFISDEGGRGPGTVTAYACR